MQRRLIRVLSTGRSGTKFLSNFFRAQGYRAFHEELYVGEPIHAIGVWMNQLSDLWAADPTAYFSLDIDYAVYADAAVNAFVTGQRRPRPSSLPERVGQVLGLTATDVVIDTQNQITPATPLIERSLGRRGVDLFNVILYRNPIKTVHAIYVTERKGEFSFRPRSFLSTDPLRSAARIWSMTYRMCHDQVARLGKDRSMLLELEALNQDADYADRVLDKLGLGFDRAAFERFQGAVNSEPLRQSKVNDNRNSDLFRSPDFQFSDVEIEQVVSEIGDVLDLFGIDPTAAADAYRRFHLTEKRFGN